jgi:TonB family protein
MMLALLLFAAASSPQRTPQPKPINPSSWFSSNDYPVEALKKGQEGTVEYELQVDAQGRPVECRIIVSSGNTDLDDRACRILQTKGRFEPAHGADGRPVASTYKNRIVWRARGEVQVWHAIILDFGADPHHPKCTEQSSEGWSPNPKSSCATVLQQDDVIEQLGRRFTRVVALTTMTDGNHEPHKADPAWGERLSWMAIEQTGVGNLPIDCRSIAAEGWAEGNDGCAGFPYGRPVSEDDLRRAIKIRSEESTFAVIRKSTRERTCEANSDASESSGCVPTVDR